MQSKKNSVGVAVVGDVLDINCWSNTPFYFYKAGHDAGSFHEPWSLNMQSFELSRKLWNLGRIFSGKGRGGYQYSKAFLDRAEQQIPKSYFSSTIISFNQVFPRASTVKAAGGRIIYYIDATLHDLFNEKDYGIQIPASMIDQALAQEIDNYSKADAVLSMGTWVHESLQQIYKLPKNKIGQVLPGANISLPADFSFSPFHEGAGTTRDFMIGFVGKDWKRKGLGILADVRDELVSRGHHVSIRAIGNIPDELKDREGITFTGFIDKQNNTDQFIEAIASCDLGCLFSTTEALGISILEFLRVGVPVAGFFHQGLKDTLMDGASIRILPGASIKTIADKIEILIVDQGVAKKLKEKSELLSNQVTWSKTIEHFQPWLR